MREGEAVDYRRMAEEFFEAMCPLMAGPVNRKVSGISKGEMAVLRYLMDVRDSATPGEISSKRQISTARVANILASLERKSFVERIRDPGDHRKVIVCITGEGRRFAHERREEALTGIASLLRDMGEEDAREYIRLTKKANALIRAQVLRDIDSDK